MFITHIHGDHQLGVLKILSEREKAGATDSIYVITPSPMLEWMQLFVTDSLTNPELVHLIPSHTLNPESSYFYQDKNSYKPHHPKDDSRAHSFCKN